MKIGKITNKEFRRLIDHALIARLNNLNTDLSIVNDKYFKLITSDNQTYTLGEWRHQRESIHRATDDIVLTRRKITNEVFVV